MSLVEILDAMIKQHKDAMDELVGIRNKIVFAAKVEAPAVKLVPTPDAVAQARAKLQAEIAKAQAEAAAKAKAQVEQVAVAPTLPEAPAAGVECYGNFDAAAVECQGCDDARKCQVATQAILSGGVAGVPGAAPIAESAVPIGIQATPEELAALAGLDPQNAQFVLEYARTDKKTVAEVRKILMI